MPESVGMMLVVVRGRSGKRWGAESHGIVMGWRWNGHLLKMTETLEWRDGSSEALWNTKSSLVGHGRASLVYRLARFLIAWGDRDSGGHSGGGQDATISEYRVE